MTNGDRIMTNFEKLKAERIKEIEDMDVEDMIQEISEGYRTCRYCEFEHSGKAKAYVKINGFCGYRCEEGIKAYLESEEE